MFEKYFHYQSTSSIVPIKEVDGKKAFMFVLREVGAIKGEREPLQHNIT